MVLGRPWVRVILIQEEATYCWHAYREQLLRRLLSFTMVTTRFPEFSTQIDIVTPLSTESSCGVGRINTVVSSTIVGGDVLVLPDVSLSPPISPLAMTFSSSLKSSTSSVELISREDDVPDVDGVPFFSFHLRLLQLGGTRKSVPANDNLSSEHQ